jgi:hypothetical protein
MGWKKPSRMSDAEFDAYIAKRIGDFLAVPLDGRFGFGRIVLHGFFAAYDLMAPEIPPVSQIAAAKVLFIVAVNYNEYATRRWKVVGHEPPEDFLMQPRKFKRKDPITGKVDIYFEGKFFPVTDEDLDKLETAAAWSADNIEARLKKHFGIKS